MTVGRRASPSPSVSGGGPAADHDPDGHWTTRRAVRSAGSVARDCSPAARAAGAYGPLHLRFGDRGGLLSPASPRAARTPPVGAGRVPNLASGSRDRVALAGDRRLDARVRGTRARLGGCLPRGLVRT